jgi:HEPN domain-containing protein
MPNKLLAAQWLNKAYHDLSSARILYTADHYTDTIGFDLQQAIEKSLKSFLAYENKAIKKSHDLVEISALVRTYIQFSDSEMDLLDMATVFYMRDRYPAISIQLPSRQQIKEVLDFAERLFDDVCLTLDIDKQEVTK